MRYCTLKRFALALPSAFMGNFMSFVANGVSITGDLVLSSGDFFPDVNLSQIRNTLRVDGTVTDIRLKQLTCEEMLDVNRLLYVLTQKAQTLDELSLGAINGKKDTDILYFSAVSNGVYARLVELYTGYDSTNSGAKKSELLEQSADDYRRNKHWAIQQLLGKNHTVVELI